MNNNDPDLKETKTILNNKEVNKESTNKVEHKNIKQSSIPKINAEATCYKVQLINKREEEVKKVNEDKKEIQRNNSAKVRAMLTIG